MSLPNLPAMRFHVDPQAVQFILKGPVQVFTLDQPLRQIRLPDGVHVLAAGRRVKDNDAIPLFVDEVEDPGRGLQPGGRLDGLEYESGAAALALGLELLVLA